MERKPFERCGVRWSRSPSCSNSATASVARMSCAPLAGIEREQDRDQPAHDMGVAVAGEGQHRARRAVRLDRGRKPHLAGAALHLVGVAARGLRQRRQRAAKLDQIAIAVVPLVQQGEILDDLVDRRSVPCPSYIGRAARAGRRKTPRRIKPCGAAPCAAADVFRARRRALPDRIEIAVFQRALRAGDAGTVRTRRELWPPASACVTEPVSLPCEA